MRLRGTYASPGLDGWGQILFTLLFIAGVAYGYLENGMEGAGGVAAVMLIAGFFLWRRIMVALFGRRLDVRIMPDVIRVKWRRYERAKVRGFRMEKHRKAREEQERQKVSGVAMATVYRRAFEIVMDYGEKRITIAALPDRDEEKAEALTYRLQSVHQGLEKIMGEESGGLAPDVFGKKPDIR